MAGPPIAEQPEKARFSPQKHRAAPHKAAKELCEGCAEERKVTDNGHGHLFCLLRDAVIRKTGTIGFPEALPHRTVRFGAGVLLLFVPAGPQ